MTGVAVIDADRRAVIGRAYLVDAVVATSSTTGRTILTEEETRDVYSDYLRGVPPVRIMEERHIGRHILTRVIRRYTRIVDRAHRIGLPASVIAEMFGCSEVVVLFAFGDDHE